MKFWHWIWNSYIDIYHPENWAKTSSSWPYYWPWKVIDIENLWNFDIDIEILTLAFKLFWYLTYFNIWYQVSGKWILCILWLLWAPREKLLVKQFHSFFFNYVCIYDEWQQSNDFFQKQKLFYSAQYGFRTEHSTEFAALELVDRVMLEMDKKNTPINISSLIFPRLLILWIMKSYCKNCFKFNGELHHK